MGSSEIKSTSNSNQNDFQQESTFTSSITKITDNRKKDNSNEIFLELFLKIIVNGNSNNDFKVSNMLIMDDKRLLVGYTLNLIIFSTKTFKRELVIDFKDILIKYNNDNSISYLTQLKNGNLAITITKDKVYFIKINNNSFKIKGNLPSKNPKKIIEKNNYLYILEDYQISVWNKKFYGLSREFIITMNGLFWPRLSYGNFIFTNDQELAVTNFQNLVFYNIESKKFSRIKGKEYSISYGIYSNNMILINKNVLLVGCIDCKWGYGSVLLIDIIKKEIIAEKVLHLYSIIKLKNGDFLCGVQESNMTNESKIMTLKIINEELIIINSQICHNKAITCFIELNNGKIISGSKDGIIKMWNKF